jgi:uncharacterized phiE125 gp8 family phage protein
VKAPKVISITAEPAIPLAECRAHLEATQYGDSDDDPVDALDDTMILAWLEAAREFCEDFLGESLTPRVLEIALDAFPTTRADGQTWIELPRGPVTEVVSVTIPDASGDSDDTDASVMDEADYVLDDFSVPARLVPAASWPAASGTNAIRIRYSAGYALDTDGQTSMPWVARAAMLLILGHLFKNREETTEKAMAHLPNGAEALMRPRRVLLGMA